MHTDPIYGYRRAVSVMAAWEQTAALTGSRRHASVAAACRAIAIEHIRAALAAEISDTERRDRLRIARETVDAAEQAAGRAAIAELRAALAALAPEPAPPAAKRGDDDQ